jgi:hypothetical protein
MTLREKINWVGNKTECMRIVDKSKLEILANRAQKVSYYWYVSETVNLAIETYLDDDIVQKNETANLAVSAAIQYFFGHWRNELKTSDGLTGQEAWRSVCLWYDELMRSLPFAAALSDWESVRKLASYPPDNKLPMPKDAKGETAWGWALISFLSDAPLVIIDQFMERAENDKAKRPKVLVPVLRALVCKDGGQFEKAIIAYLAFFRKSEFKHELIKLLSLDGTTLYHLGRKQGFIVQLPPDLADCIIRLD